MEFSLQSVAKQSQGVSKPSNVFGVASVFSKNSAASQAKQDVQSLIKVNQSKYQAQEADAYVKAIEQDPLAFEYDSFC